MMKKTAQATCACLILSSTPLCAEVNENYLAPFSIKNQNPFINIYGLPATEPAKLMKADQQTTDIVLDMANNSMLNQDEVNEEVFLDGETYRLSLTFRLGQRDGMEYGVELPFIAHGEIIIRLIYVF